MTINTMDMQNIVRDSITGFNTRVQAHYESLTDEDIAKLDHTLHAILEPKVSDAAIQNRQYNPATDTVEEI